MNSLNPGIKDWHNFFLCAILVFQQIGTDWVNQNFGSISLGFDFEIFANFFLIAWAAPKCVLKITQSFNLITSVIFIYT